MPASALFAGLKFLPGEKAMGHGYGYFPENTEDIYAGIEYPWIRRGRQAAEVSARRDKLTKSVPDTSGFGIAGFEEGSKRLVRAAIRYAIKEGERV